NLVVGDFGVGRYNQSAGSAVGRNLFVGNSFGSATDIGSGTVALSGGTLTFSGTANIGVSGHGTFNHSGGTLTTEWLFLGSNSNGSNGLSNGAYNMSNGATLHVNGLESVGDSGFAVFTQTGGIHIVGGNLLIGDHPSAIGSYNLSADTGPSTLTVAGVEAVGGAATGGGWSAGGVFNQSGGVHTVGSG